jgi:hypothetical protein
VLPKERSVPSHENSGWASGSKVAVSCRLCRYAWQVSISPLCRSLTSPRLTLENALGDPGHSPGAADHMKWQRHYVGASPGVARVDLRGCAQISSGRAPCDILPTILTDSLRIVGKAPLGKRGQKRLARGMGRSLFLANGEPALEIMGQVPLVPTFVEEPARNMAKLIAGERDLQPAIGVLGHSEPLVEVAPNLIRIRLAQLNSG